MEHSDQIVFEDGFTAGNPRLAGLRFSIEPAPGWSLSANRLMQYGGGERGGDSFGDFFDALVQAAPDTTTQRQPSRRASSATRSPRGPAASSFPGDTPFAVYLEYAGEDSSYEGNYRLGNAALSVGIDFSAAVAIASISRTKLSEWQNGWYVHGIYLDGLTNDGRVLGHWGADRRVFGDAVGAQTHMLRRRLGAAVRRLSAGARRARLPTKITRPNDYERGYDADA